MTPKTLTYGNEGFLEIEQFLSKNRRDDYTLSIYNILEGCTMEIDCPFEEMLQAITTVTNIEHDFPAWIGINELSESYVVGLNFTRGSLETPGVYKFEDGKFKKIHSGIEA